MKKIIIAVASAALMCVMLTCCAKKNNITVQPEVTAEPEKTYSPNDYQKDETVKDMDTGIVYNTVRQPEEYAEVIDEYLRLYEASKKDNFDEYLQSEECRLELLYEGYDRDYISNTLLDFNNYVYTLGGNFIIDYRDINSDDEVELVLCYDVDVEEFEKTTLAIYTFYEDRVMLVDCYNALRSLRKIEDGKMYVTNYNSGDEAKGDYVYSIENGKAKQESFTKAK